MGEFANTFFIEVLGPAYSDMSHCRFEAFRLCGSAVLPDLSSSLEKTPISDLTSYPNLKGSYLSRTMINSMNKVFMADRLASMPFFSINTGSAIFKFPTL
ncbi:hypothetical protein AVEN_213266-1 [Araneus ventricosus]|uniref:Uncharacterized protein n=1 Tax=Araneus ventricosus TaxID=182803 RepID=A0A4Y2DDN6_ARAVE|nr:hypothetical protein AVEN_213266-1 [Araneus ventricosus]